MPRLKGYKISCEVCGAYSATSKYNKRDATLTFKDRGWMLKKGGLWYCKDHKPVSAKQKDSAETFARYWALFALKESTYEREYRFCNRLWRFDFAWPEQRLAVEIDGGRHIVRHGAKGTAVGGRHNTDTDDEKLNEAAILGWRIMRFSKQALERNPLKVINTVRRGLGLEEVQS